jgi:hypothetical protein
MIKVTTTATRSLFRTSRAARIKNTNHITNAETAIVPYRPVASHMCNEPYLAPP